MAGNIPPLVSSTPPPLNAFDDDEEEEEDEFGLYTAAEEIDYSECISFKEKDEEKQNVCKPNGEQDSTSQDSATDSGLCPDSEGMSPTPHSDDERTLKQNTCDKLCQKPVKQAQSGASEPRDCEEAVSVNIETVSCPSLPNGHGGESNSDQESDDDFGSFEFASSNKGQTVVEESSGGSVSRNKSPTNDVQLTEVEDHNVVDVHPHDEQFIKEIKESGKKLSEFNTLKTCVNGLEDSDCTFAEEKTCKYDQSNAKFDEYSVEKLEIVSSNDNSSFNSVDSSLEQKEATIGEFHNNEQNGMHITEEIPKDHDDALKSTTENLDYREDSEVQLEDGDDTEFDDFTDFKADFSGSCDLSKSEQGDKFNEHSKTFVEHTKLEEATSSFPPSNQEESDDEFSNFADFSSSDCAFVSAQNSNSLENVSHIPLKLDDNDLRTESEFQDWVSVFPSEEDSTPQVASALLRQDDVVWSRLFPLESSPALSYQWNESLSNRRLLAALNIDSRNILFTPWNASAVPRFAANLSCGPLEPIKATEPLQPAAAPPSIITTNAAATSTSTVTVVQESVPDAHFDWVGSGLTNPLDCPKTVLNLPKTLSADAENILNSLPDISFMRKTYIDFPINEA